MDDSRRELEQESVEANAEAQGSSTQAEERREGPVLRRGRQVRSSTTDQRLLDSRGPSDWVHTDPWRVMRVPLEGGGRLVVELNAEEAATLAEALKAVTS